ncbi:MAG TPA: SAM-dependent methyltransferase [Balneolaceae bacterium]|nr:SAM-dependent methyltransferase [Balneolaceae bacterium]
MPSSNTGKGILYLIPNTLGKTPENNTIPDFVLNIIRRLDVMIVENVQTAARYLQWVGDTIPEYEIDFLLLNKKTPAHEIASFMNPLKNGQDAGLLSEAGCPVIADPGSELIKMAHAQNIKVSPLVGPSSILLALMGSGFNGQQFCFHGYLPIDQNNRRQAIQKLEQESRAEQSTQIFMEAPHRNDAIVKDVIKHCQPDTRFCTATNLTLPDERIISKRISEWRRDSGPSIHKEPTIFLVSGT